MTVKEDGAANCRPRMGATEIDYVSNTLPPNSRREYFMMGAATSTVAVGAQIEMLCQATPGIAVTARWARIQALAVSRLTGSAPRGD